jgi:hypothetical protein
LLRYARNAKGIHAKAAKNKCIFLRPLRVFNFCVANAESALRFLYLPHAKSIPNPYSSSSAHPANFQEKF